MNLVRHRGGLVILLSFATAMLLTIIPLPENLRLLRPDWVGLILIFWCLALPERVSVGSGFFAGLILDVLTGTLFGQHAMALSIMTYLCVRMHQQIRAYPLWQQSLTVLLFLIVHQLISLWINSAIGRPSPDWGYWISPLTSALIWPLAYPLMRTLQYGFSVR